MANLERLYTHHHVEEVAVILARASMMAKERPDLTVYDLQTAFTLGYEQSVILLDWLADSDKVHARVSNHWLRCGRAYVRNNLSSGLVDMGARLEMGDRRAFSLMLALQSRGVIRIEPDFMFERRVRMTSFDDLVRQMQRVGKKYRGRCEPALLMRTLYVDVFTAVRLAQYGEEHCGLRWKDRSKGML